MPDRRQASLTAGTLLLPAAAGAAAFVLPVHLASNLSGVAGLADLAWLGPVFAAYFAVRFALGPALATLADRRGPARPLIGLTLAGLVAVGTALCVPGTWPVVAVQLALGLCAGAARPLLLAGAAQRPRTADNQTQNQNKSLTKSLALQQAALNLGPWLAGLGLALGGQRLALAGAGALLLLALAAFLLLPALPGAPAPRSGLRALLNETLARRRHRSLLAAVLGRSAAAGTWVAFGPAVLALLTPDAPMAVAGLFTLPAFAAALAMLPLNKNTAAPDARCTAGMAASGLGLAAMALAAHHFPDHMWLLAAGGLVLGIGTAISLPPSTLLAAALLPDRPAASLAVFQAVAGLGFALGPLAGGLAIRMGLPLAAPLALGGVFAALGGLLLLPPGRKKTVSFAAASAACCTVALATLSPASSRLTDDSGVHQYSAPLMGTVVHLSLPGNAGAARRAADQTFDRMRHLAQDLDHRQPHGAVGRINHAAGHRPVRVSPWVFGLLRDSLELARASDGAFDPTVGALTRSPLSYALPRPALAGARALVDYRKVRLNEQEHTVFLQAEGMALDLGGLAKGAVVDEAVALLRSLGITDGVVEAGGDMYAFGKRQWRAGLEQPRSRELLGTVPLREAGLCGSGDYRRGLDLPGGQRVHHILDPFRLLPAQNAAAVYVLAASARQADGLATTLAVLGPGKGPAWLAGHAPNAAALWLDERGNVAANAGFPPWTAPPE